MVIKTAWLLFISCYSTLVGVFLKIKNSILSWGIFPNISMKLLTTQNYDFSSFGRRLNKSKYLWKKNNRKQYCWITSNWIKQKSKTELHLFLKLDHEEIANWRQTKQGKYFMVSKEISRHFSGTLKIHAHIHTKLTQILHPFKQLTSLFYFWSNTGS